MIKRFAYEKLSGLWSRELIFHPDINVLTGKNGAGKTSILKLLWYMISGNIERIIPEIRFDSAEVETDALFLRIEMAQSGPYQQANLKWDIGKGEKKTTIICKQSLIERGRFHEIDAEIATVSGSSVFFPTFRRIEGGFSVSGHNPANRMRSPLQESMRELSDSLSYEKHIFVSSLSTDDLESLLTKQYADTSRKANDLHVSLAAFILTTIKSYSQVDDVSTQESLDAARAILDSIRDQAKANEDKREMLFLPFTVLIKLVGDLLQHKGISFKNITTFGDVSSAVEAGHLSAGEKQMLSFLCYNAFNRNSAIFIDEPEISLHVDWQRILFPKLLEQCVNNQFIVATHSPFIYTKYVDKEHRLDEDVGYTERHGDADHR